MFRSLVKNIAKWEVILIILAVLVTGITVFIYLRNNTTEGFYPVNAQRIDYEEKAKRTYNDYADIQDQKGFGSIPGGPAGDIYLNRLLNGPTYEEDSSKANIAGTSNSSEFRYRAPPEQTELLSKIKMCEALKSWDCTKISDPNFERFCGICTDGEDHKGEPHIGGLYVDPRNRKIEQDNADKDKRKPKFKPTVGRCKGKFYLTRPLCDIDKDRNDCSKYVNFESQDSKDKCGMCVTNNNMVYLGNRADKDKDYALIPKPVTFKTTLKFAVAEAHKATVGVYTMSNSKWIQVPEGSFIQNTNIYYITLEGQENQQFKIRISYPEYLPQYWTEAETNRISTLVNPKRVQLVRASYGPNINDYTKDDPRAKDVTEYIKSTFKINDCGKTVIAINNNSMGGDPNPGIVKQLRLVYGDNGSDFAFSWGREGGESKAVATDNLDELCPTGISPSEAEKQVCETDTAGATIEGRVYTQGNNNGYSGGGTAFCVKKIADTPRGIVGVWESLGRVPRTVPLDLSVTQINGYDVGSLGPPKLGTLTGSKVFRTIAPPSSSPGIPGNLFWFWAKDRFLAKVEFTIVIPATLRDPTVQEDIQLCPMGPIVSTEEGAKRMQAGMCDQPINGQPQVPGSYSDGCIQALFLGAGCSKKGKGYPSNGQKKNVFTKNSLTGDNLSIDEIIDNLYETYLIATTGTNSNGDTLEDSTFEKYAEDCLGEVLRTPCDNVNSATGPHTPQCLDYLFKNAGSANKLVGQTYNGMSNRSSGSGATKKSPIMYCQRVGSLSPITQSGKLNNEAIRLANAQGGLSAVKEFYRKVHYDANYSSNVKQQKVALQQCYGIDVPATPVICPIKPCSNILLPQNVSLIKGNKIATLIHNGDYDLSFKINVKGVISTNWGSILHFTKSGRDCCGLGDRGPGIWFYPNTLKMYIILGDSTQGGDWGIRDVDIILPTGESSFMLSCKGSSITVTVNGKQYKVTQPGIRPSGSFDVYAADPWYEAANAELKSLCFVPG